MTDFPSFGSEPPGRFFIKMHGLHNHFVITDARAEEFRPHPDEIVRVCDPKVGVGGDQLIIIEAAKNADHANAFMRILNVDGREVEACGNATRCVAWLLMEESGRDEVVIETLAGLIECTRIADMEVCCSMGRVSMDWKEIPLAEERDTCHLELNFGPLNDAIALNIGNPHIVYFVEDIDLIDIESLAPKIQKHPLFPNEVNVGIAEVVSDDHIRSVVYERGAGLTTACGSGACVAAYAALVRGLTDKRELTVSMPAGDVRIGIDRDGVATMTGPVAYCFSGYF
jgi:diaminopimelate epimerase